MSSGYRVLSVQDIRTFPPITWLAQNTIPNGSLSVIFGPSNIGKSFVALDLAHSVATGTRWMGKRIARGPVIYVAAGEGVSGLRQRMEAWELERGVGLDDVVYVTDAVQLHQYSNVSKFMRNVRDIQPQLVVFDTLARCFAGGNENATEDMGKVISACDEIKATGAAVVLVHHTGHPDEEGNQKHRARGSSSLPAAIDTSIEVCLPAGGELDSNSDRVLRCRKQKDAEWFHPMAFTLKAVRRSGRTLSLVPVVSRVGINGSRPAA